MENLDRITIRDLLVRGIVGIYPDERVNKQNILLNVTLWADTRPAAASEDIADTVNYATIAQALIDYVEQSEPLLVEKLAAELVKICFAADEKVQAVELTVEKPDALSYAEAVGVTIFRRRGE
jgi:dihydroneopterin aldolase/D-erythro-7,8-dihydroneopterin triphosphate epimerase